MMRHRMLKGLRAVSILLGATGLLAASNNLQAVVNQCPQPVASQPVTSQPVASQPVTSQPVTLYNGHEVVPGEIVVKFLDPLIAVTAAQDLGADIDEELDGTGTHRMHSSLYDTVTLLAIVARRTDVAYAGPNYIVHTFQTPTDPFFGRLWGMSNTGQAIQNVSGTSGADIGATQAWGTTTGSPLNVVAVIDTGIDYNHPDLRNNVWSAPKPFMVTLGGRTITCPAGSFGFNAITNSCDPMDDNGHGTHVSGTIGAVASNGMGVAGVNWTASILGLKFLDSTGAGTTANAIKAIEFVIQVKNQFGLQGNVRVLSNSWGGTGNDPALNVAIQKAYANDMLFVAAAGNAIVGANNDITPTYPAAYPNVIAVAATDNRDRLASFSNYGATTVALGAPGVDIYSTYRGNQYMYLSGTSMATPHVSGVAALVLSAPGCGNLNATSLRDILLNNTVPIPSLAGKTITGGRLSADKAVINCAALQPPPQPPAQPPAPDFSIAASPLSLSVKRGQSASFTVTTKVLTGAPGPIGLTVTGLPRGASAGFSPKSVTVGASSKMTVKTSSKTSKGTYPLTIMGTAGTVSHTVPVSLTVR